MFFDPSRDFDKLNLKATIVSAVVIDNDDPEQLFRIKIRCNEIHKGVPDEHLPWARPVAIPIGPGSGTVQGLIAIPNINTKVAVMFQDNSDNYPVYLGAIMTEDVKLNELLEDYPNSYGWIDKANNKFFINTNTNNVVFHHKSGTKINIDGSGNIEITGATTNLNVNGDLNVKSSGNVKIDGNIQLTMDAPTIHLNSGSPSSPTALSPRPATGQSSPTIPEK